jgi:hypothetical protein
MKTSPYKKDIKLIIRSGFVSLSLTFPKIQFRIGSEKVISAKIIALRMPIFIIRERGFIFFALIKSNIYRIKNAAVRITKISFKTLKKKVSFELKNSLKKNKIIANPTNAWNLMFLLRFAFLNFMSFYRLRSKLKIMLLFSL